MTTLRKRLPVPLVLILLLGTGTGDSGLSNESRANRALFRGDRAFAAQDYCEAEIEYRDVVTISSQNAAAIRQLGFIYSEQGRVAKAYEYLQRAALLEPENDAVLLKLGATFLAVGGYGDARNAALRILVRQPDDDQALLLLIDAVSAPAEIEEARERIEALRQTHRDRAGYHLALGMLDLRQRDPSNAERELSEALRFDPESGAAKFVLGNIYWMRHELKEADRFLGAAAKLAPLRSPWRLRYADFQRQTGGFEAARKSLEEITTKAPDYLPAWIDLMNLVCRKGQNHDCADIIERILVQDPVNYQALLARADLKVTEGKVLEALIEFDRLRTLYYRVPDVHYRMALAELASHNVDAAVRSLTQAINLAPDFDEAILLRDDINIARGELAPAITSLTQVVERRPQRVNAHLMLAGAYLIEKHTDQAVAVYRQMVKLFPKDPQPSFLIGILFARQDRADDARMAFEEALRIAPAYLPALQQLVGLDLAAHRNSAAMTRVHGEIERHPENSGLWCLEAEINMSQQNFPGAEASLRKALDLDGNLEAAHLLLAENYIAQHKYQEALDDLMPFAAKNNNLAALMQIGLIQTQLRQFGAARDSYERLLAINPNFGPALNNLANIYSDQLSQLDKAYELAERARKALPDDPHAADTLGWIYFKKGLYHSALSVLEQSAAKLPAEPEPQFHLGMALSMIGNKDDARRALQRAAEASKDFPDKEEARRRLKELAKVPARVME
jgi:tetratricopeptide (TPR) repeat protein